MLELFEELNLSVLYHWILLGGTGTMNKVDQKQHSISFLGEFSDKNLEKQFFDYYFKRIIKYIRPIILCLGILNMLFIIPDYFLINNPVNFIGVLATRTIILLLTISLFVLMKNVNNSIKLAYWITFLEIFCVISFLFIFSQYESPNYLIQAFGVMVIILGIFLIPNKWINSLIASSIVSVMFFVLSAYYIKEMEFAEYSAGIGYILIVLLLSSIEAFRNCYYTRKQYVYSSELLTLSTIDPLTGIYNRVKFDEELKKWIGYSKRYGTPFSLIIFDFDDFKNVNDTYGHIIGDKVIVEIVNIVKDSIRQTDVFARWGGEEFVLLFPNTNRQEAMELVERLRILISSNIFEKVGTVTCSFGLAMFQENDNEDTLLNRADEFLYVAKRQGKNRVAS